MTGPPALPAIPNTPAVYRFLPNGALDTSYSGDGIGTGTPLGAAPAFSEAYDVAIQEGERYVLTGYGNTATPGSTVDMVAYRFKANGDLDPSFGTGGVTRYDAGLGQEDRGRDINVTSEGRIVIAGSSAQGAGDLIAAVYLLRPNGQFETTFGVGGAMKVDMGGTVDAFFGLSDTASDTRATVAGYKGVTGGAGDDAAVVRLNLDLENTGPAGAPGPQGLPGPAAGARRRDGDRAADAHDDGRARQPQGDDRHDEAERIDRLGAVELRRRRTLQGHRAPALRRAGARRALAEGHQRDADGGVQPHGRHEDRAAHAVAGRQERAQPRQAAVGQGRRRSGLGLDRHEAGNAAALTPRRTALDDRARAGSPARVLVVGRAVFAAGDRYG